MIVCDLIWYVLFLCFNAVRILGKTKQFVRSLACLRRKNVKKMSEKKKRERENIYFYIFFIENKQGAG